MLYDYVRYSKDNSIMDIVVGSDTVLGKAEVVMKKLGEFETDNGLIYKDGPFNRRDWVDEINRWGYVTYDEILYARALYSLSKLFAITEIKRKPIRMRQSMKEPRRVSTKCFGMKNLVITSTIKMKYTLKITCPLTQFGLLFSVLQMKNVQNVS